MTGACRGDSTQIAPFSHRLAAQHGGAMRLLLVAVDDPRASMGLPWDDQTASAGTPQPLSRGAACAVHSAWLAIGSEANMAPLVYRSFCFLRLVSAPLASDIYAVSP